MLKAKVWKVAVSLVVAGALVASLMLAAGVFTPQADGKSTYIVVFDDMPQDALAKAESGVANIVVSSGGQVLAVYTVIDGMAVTVPDVALGRISGAEGVKYVEKDRPARLQMDQAAEQLNVLPVWSGTWNGGVQGYDGSNVLIAIVDSGVDLNHPDLAGKVLDQAYFSNPSNTRELDLNGHGTFVASEILGSGLKSTPSIILPNGVVHQPLKGIAPGAKLISARVSYEDGSSSTKTMLDGLNWVFNHNPRPQIISISMATMHAPDVNGNLPALDEAVKRAYDAGIVVVAAAGNEGPGESTVMCPGDSPYTITVGSVDRDNLVSRFSSRGPGQGLFKPDVMGSGQNIVAARPVNMYASNDYDKYYTTQTGTSMAAPEVTGIVALMLQYKPDLKPDQIKEVLMRTAHKPAGVSPTADLNYGAGIVDAAAAFRYLETNTIPPEAGKPVASVHFNNTGYTVGENAGTLIAGVVVEWIDPSKGPITVSYGAQSDTAIAGQDFALVPGTLEFTPGGPRELPVAIDVINDQAPGSNKHFALTLSSTDNVKCSPATASVSLAETDNAIVRFDVASYTVKQGHTSLEVEVVCDRSKIEDTARTTVMVDYGTFNGSLCEGVNFNAARGTLTFGSDADGSYPAIDRQSFTISGIGGPANAEGMYFNLQLNNPINALLGSPCNSKVWVTYSASNLDQVQPESDGSLSSADLPTEGWYTSNVGVTLTAGDDQGSGISYIEYSLSEGPWQKYDAPLNVSSDGHFTVEYYARDNAGNAGPVKQLSFDVDQHPPVTSTSLDRPVPLCGFYESGVTVTLSADDSGGSGVGRIEYSLNGDDWTEYTAPFTVAVEGTNTIEYRSTDKLGHLEDAGSRIFRISANPPVTSCTTNPADTLPCGWYNQEIAITITVTDPSASGLKSLDYRLNGGAWMPYTQPFTVSAEGLNAVEYRATSNTGIEAVSSYDIKIDRSAPISVCTLSPETETGWTKEDTIVTLSATDLLSSGEDGSGVESIVYSLDDGKTWTTYTEPFPVSHEGIAVMLYHAIDKAGNAEADRTQRIAIDRTLPKVTIVTTPDSPSSDGYYYGSVTVQYTASDSGSGIDGSTTWSEVLSEPGDNQVSSWPVTDRAGNAVTATAGPFNIRGAILTLGDITVPTTPIALNSGAATVTASDTFSGWSQGISSKWDWGDGTITTGVIDGDKITGNHQYTKAGVYTITLTAQNSGGITATANYEFVVIYDPKAGYVIGNGWYNSPSGRYLPDSALGGKASFGFTSKYAKNLITGQTQFRLGKITFQSTGLDWLVVAKPKAIYQGSGTINGRGNYGFLVSMIDGSRDRLRIKIWDKATGAVVYDNQPGDVDYADPIQTLGGGSILLQKV